MAGIFPDLETQIVVGTKLNFENSLNKLLQKGWVMNLATFRVTGRFDDTYHVVVVREAGA